MATLFKELFSFQGRASKYQFRLVAIILFFLFWFFLTSLSVLAWGLNATSTALRS
jgi:uncharacterized membrane protein YhaH (DUF805 family)